MEGGKNFFTSIVYLILLLMAGYKAWIAGDDAFLCLCVVGFWGISWYIYFIITLKEKGR